MQTRWGKLAMIAALVVGGVMSGTSRAHAQDAVDRFQPLVEISAHRLQIAEQVALAKWDSGAAVEDAARETHEIEAVVKAGEPKGLSEGFVADFFKAQIEANKVVQYSLLADWYRSGAAPAHARINLVATIRPQLDQIQDALIAELAHTADLRSSATCRADVAKAVGKYRSSHKQDVGPLHEIALDRAMAATCGAGR